MTCSLSMKQPCLTWHTFADHPYRVPPDAVLCQPRGAGLCPGPETRVLVSFELRSSAVKETFLQEAHKAFSQVGVEQSTLGRAALWWSILLLHSHSSW